MRLGPLRIPSPLLLAAVLLQASIVLGIKFELEASSYPRPRCVWNFAGAKSLVIVTANAPATPGQRVDVEILDGSARGHVYLSKKDIKGETRLAITTQENADVGVCLRNYLESGTGKHYRTVDLDIDIGAEAIDYNAIANQESLSVLEVEMRKLEAVVKEVVDELGYLHRREIKMRDTNESTNTRVKWFSVGIMVVIVGLGVFQAWADAIRMKDK